MDAHKSIIGAQYKHLMWALYFMKVYGNEENNSNFAGGVDEKTFRKWSHIFVEVPTENFRKYKKSTLSQERISKLTELNLKW